MSENKTIVKGLFVLAGLILLGLTVNIVINYQTNQILKHGKKTDAHILSVKMHVKPTVPSIKYYYLVKGDTITFCYLDDKGVKLNKLKELEGTVVPVIYDSTNIKKSLLIINEDEYK